MRNETSCTNCAAQSHLAKFLISGETSAKNQYMNINLLEGGKFKDTGSQQYDNFTDTLDLKMSSYLNPRKKCVSSVLKKFKIRLV